LTAETSSCPRGGSRSATARTTDRARWRFTPARSRRSTRTPACATNYARAPKDPSFLLTNVGTRLYYGTVWHEFDRLRRRAVLDRETLGRQARMHDLRHGFV